MARATYTVVKPIAVINGQAVKHYSRPGTEVELDEATAAPLLESGRITAAEKAPSRRKR